ncbi:MAG: cobalamin-binding protein [Candidatus Thermofonsia Clade 1 bacterium]|jgi:iron complex transport system substrate-binding protein|uniref:Cobalamin-binding protein n=1 Tax=Candidatus Thermofonsia Clade 1 bacterium TaxID=2364210 RepID=A0A2M8PCH8_9CHLR|nr:MAG: cobalamin-binding protein [Candidatus Thermofonsia Clade 1 bacterium]RMF52883.1 MAG: cobalamin-binding protein [Chloroflexota bacterium]
MRVVSLLPSSTEIVCALGMADHLVGRSHECDYPEQVKALPVCTAPKFDPHGTSAEINQRVREVLREALSVYRVDEALLQRLQPDVILTQSLCEVCAVSLAEVQKAVCTWSQAARIVSLEPNRLEDIFADIHRVAEALGVPESGERLVMDIRWRMEVVADRAQRLPHKPTVACLEWIDPLMAAGNWIPQLVEMAGGINLFGEAGAHSPWLAWEALREADPEVIILMPCGFDIARTAQDLPILQALEGWHKLRAVQTGQVYLTDGNQYFNRPGPRLLQSLEILAEILHPKVFPFGHRGKGWQVASL